MLKQTILVLLLLFNVKLMAQNLVIQVFDYKSFLQESKYRSPQIVDRLIVQTSNWLIVDSLKTEELPMGGVLFEIPHWISVYKSTSEIYFSGLYLTRLPKELCELEHLHTLQVSFLNTLDIENVVSVLSKLKSMKKLDISGSVISTSQLEALKSGLKGIEIFDIHRM